MEIIDQTPFVLQPRAEMIKLGVVKYLDLPPSVFSQLRPGSIVKVCAKATKFETSDCESFWVIITSCDPPRKTFVGRIDNRLKRTDLHGLAMGQTLKFKRAHILDVLLSK